MATGRFSTSTRDYTAMLRHVREQWPHHPRANGRPG